MFFSFVDAEIHQGVHEGARGEREVSGRREEADDAQASRRGDDDAGSWDEDAGAAEGRYGSGGEERTRKTAGDDEGGDGAKS